MTGFAQLSPLGAADVIEKASIPEPQRLLADFAVAGVVRTYARVIETISAGTCAPRMLDATVSEAVWRRIIAEGKAEDVWATATARLEGSPNLGTLAVSVFGITFNAADVQAAARRHGRTLESDPEPPASDIPARATPAAPQARSTGPKQRAGTIVQPSIPAKRSASASSIVFQLSVSRPPPLAMRYLSAKAAASGEGVAISASSAACSRYCVSNAENEPGPVERLVTVSVVVARADAPAVAGRCSC